MIRVLLTMIKRSGLRIIKMKSFFLVVVSLMMFGCSKNVERGYYVNGQLKFSVPLKDQERHGSLYQYYDNGSLYMTSEWTEGKKNGNTISYHKNGKTHTVEIYKVGILSDSITVFDSIGNIEQISYVESGKKHGLYRGFYPNGNLKVKGLYEDDKKIGKAEIYHSDGSIESRKIFNNDTTIYEVHYSKRGTPYDIFMPISIEVTDSLDYYISLIQLDYGFYDNGYIGVIIGNLDEKYKLIDTVEVLNSKSNSRKIEYIFKKNLIQNKNLQGILFEIDSADNIEVEIPFTFDLKKHR